MIVIVLCVCAKLMTFSADLLEHYATRDHHCLYQALLVPKQADTVSYVIRFIWCLQD